MPSCRAPIASARPVVSSSPTETSTGGDLVEIVMPALGVSVAEGTVVSWHLRPGDDVAADDPIGEVSTDKIDSEIPAPCDGRIVEIFVEEGETVPVGTLLATLRSAAERA